MKTIAIRLPDVEAAMLLEVGKVQKRSRAFRDLEQLMIKKIREEYLKCVKLGAGDLAQSAKNACFP